MRFSTRWLLGGMALVCVVLATAGRGVFHSARVVDAGKQLRSHGVTVVFDWEGVVSEFPSSFGPLPPSVVEGERVRTRIEFGGWTIAGGNRAIEALEFKSVEFTPDVINLMESVDSVTLLRIENCEVPLRACEAIGNIKGIVAVQVNDSRVHGLKTMLAGSRESLDSVYWNHSSLPEHEASVFRELTNLRTLDLRDSEVTDRHLEHVGAASNLQYLSLNSPAITNAGLQQLKRVAKLSVLHLEHAKVSDDALVSFAEKSSIEVIIIHDWARASQIEKRVSRSRFEVW